MRRRLLDTTAAVLVAMACVGPAAAEVYFVAGTLSQAWDPVFTQFPTTGTGSLATGTFSLRYDTESNTASQITLDVHGLTIADLDDPWEVAGVHLHPPGNGAHAIRISDLGLVDGPDGFSLANASAPLLEVYEADLLAGQTWLNVHTDAFPNGEIAGRIQVVRRVPSMGMGTASVLIASLMFFGFKAWAERGRGSGLSGLIRRG